MNPDMLLTGTMGDLVTTRNASLPSPAELRLIFEALSKFITQYESSPKDEKREILKHIQDAAISLARTSASPMEGLMSFLFQPHHNACVRVAIGMGVFDHITARGGPISLELLAEKTGSEPEFVFRILRALVAMDILHESQPGYYSHTPLSELLADRGIQAYAVHQWDNINFCMSQFGSYFEKHGYRSPADPKNAPFTCAMGMENASFFEILELNPTRMDVFNRGMAGFNTGVVALYDFGSLENISQEAVAIVDVGGGNGHTLLEILDTFPALKGRCVLQDLPAVLQGNVVIPDGDICLQPYDFFREVQPVNGAYFSSSGRIPHAISEYFAWLIRHQELQYICTNGFFTIGQTQTAGPSSETYLQL
jgi:hypothetical protein